MFRLILAQGERAVECGGTLRHRWLDRRKKMTQAVAAIISEGVAAGDIRPDIPVEVLAEYLLGMLRTRVWELESRPEARRSHEATVELFLNGAGAPRRSP